MLRQDAGRFILEIIIVLPLGFSIKNIISFRFMLGKYLSDKKIPFKLPYFSQYPKLPPKKIGPAEGNYIPYFCIWRILESQNPPKISICWCILGPSKTSKISVCWFMLETRKRRRQLEMAVAGNTPTASF